MTHYFTRNRKSFKPPLSFFLHFSPLIRKIFAEMPNIYLTKTSESVKIPVFFRFEKIFSKILPILTISGGMGS